MTCLFLHPLGMRCQLERDHRGDHRNGEFAWSQTCNALRVIA